MVTKKNSTGGQEENAGRVDLDKLQLNKETVKDLTDSEQKQVKGGALPLNDKIKVSDRPSRCDATCVC